LTVFLFVGVFRYTWNYSSWKAKAVNCHSCESVFVVNVAARKLLHTKLHHSRSGQPSSNSSNSSRRPFSSTIHSVHRHLPLNVLLQEVLVIGQGDEHPPTLT